MQEPTIGADGLQVRVDFAPERATLSQLEGNLNGGTLTGSGGVNVKNGTLRDLDLNVKVNGFGLDAADEPAQPERCGHPHHPA